VSAILGIDAAWTAGRPSGVALLQQRGERWRCAALAPSYAQFVGLAAGNAVDWQARPPGSVPDLATLLRVSQQLLEWEPVQVIAVDMPLSLEPIRKRRAADAAVSRAFGAQGCAVHSPSAERPGALADRLRAEAARFGYPLATTVTVTGRTPALLKVYPHPALLRLLDARYRVPYKVANRRKYWPDATPAERLAHVLQQLDEIRCALQHEIDGVPLDVPPLVDIVSAASLKAIEDTLDALICSWVGDHRPAFRVLHLGDPAGLEGGGEQAVLELAERQQALRDQYDAVGRSGEEQRRGGDDAERLRLTGVALERREMAARERRAVHRHRQHREAVTLAQGREHRRLRLAVRAVAAKEEQDAGLTGDLLQQRSALFRHLFVDEVGGEVGGGALGDLVKERSELHRALRGRREPACLVHGDALQVQVQRDVVGGGIVDRLVAIGAEALAQPGGRHWRRSGRCVTRRGRRRGRRQRW